MYADVAYFHKQAASFIHGDVICIDPEELLHVRKEGPNRHLSYFIHV